MDPDFLEALDNHASSRRQAERKTHQFCRQVQRALNFALSNLDGLYVEEVSPAPDCGRLLVHVLVPNGQPVADVMTTLARQTPRLRSEVASAITRKRAPELCFVPVSAEEVVHD